VKSKILWLEGKKSDSTTMLNALRKEGHHIEIVYTLKLAVESIQTLDPDLIIAYTPSLKLNRRRICHSLKEVTNNKPLLLITPQDQISPEDTEADAMIITPCTTRKLMLRVRQLIPTVIRVGKISLDLEHNLVRCMDKEGQLNPRLTKLLRRLMQNPGEVIERKRLFAEVWHTDYTNDTRTLDVHISWLRRVIEEDPKAPKHLITIRGIGYRLDT
jgi:DNA-binding response OmpR family regulator